MVNCEYKLHDEVSTLVKWLPQEGKKLDVELDFVDKFTKLLFPHIEDIAIRKKKYRLLRKSLSDCKNIIERYINIKKFDKIDISKLNHNQFYKLYAYIKNDDRYKTQIEEYLYKFFSKLKFYDFIKILYNHDYTKYRHVVNKVWNVRKIIYKDDIYFIPNLNKKTVVVVDLNNDVVGYQYNIIIGLLILIYSLKKSQIIVNNKKGTELELTNDVISNINMIKLQLSASEPLNIGRFDIDKDSNVLVLSTQETPSIYKLLWSKYNITYWEIKKGKIDVQTSKVTNGIKYITGSFRYHREINKLPKFNL
jgi:hypothetical protein